MRVYKVLPKYSRLYAPISKRYRIYVQFCSLCLIFPQDCFVNIISGLFSVLLRDQALMSGDGPKWMVMDGDIDPMWIESLNTVMDDNKVSC